MEWCDCSPEMTTFGFPEVGSGTCTGDQSSKKIKFFNVIFLENPENALNLKIFSKKAVLLNFLEFWNFFKDHFFGTLL